MSTTAYWVLPDDQLPTIGSGFRRVLVHDELGTDGRTVTITDASGVADTHIRLDVWESIPHTEDTDQPLAAILAALRNYDARLIRDEKGRRK